MQTFAGGTSLIGSEKKRKQTGDGEQASVEELVAEVRTVYKGMGVALIKVRKAS